MKLDFTRDYEAFGKMSNFPFHKNILKMFFVPLLFVPPGVVAILSEGDPFLEQSRIKEQTSKAAARKKLMK